MPRKTKRVSVDRRALDKMIRNRAYSRTLDRLIRNAAPGSSVSFDGYDSSHLETFEQEKQRLKDYLQIEDVYAKGVTNENSNRR